MKPDEADRAGPPRVAVALPDDALRQRVMQALSELEVEVERLAPDLDLRRVLGRVDAEIVLLHRSQLSGADLTVMREDSLQSGGPVVVVITEGLDGADHAEIIAAGAARVLDASESSQYLASALEILAEAEVAGGQDGPERIDSSAEPRLADFLSESPYMREFMGIARQVTDADSSLLITGETGVGKERLARAIHAESPRANAPFVAVNCGALPEALLESELFGHEKGAFTGAAGVRKGRFEEANGGTIFLDEIGEMPAHMQVNLLSVLQNGRVRRLGGTKELRLDVRVMAATHRNVERDVEAGKFRSDLYYRLNVIGLEIPALRERREDIPHLVGQLIRFFREHTTGSSAETIDPDALEALEAHDWPGNMRELINVIERASLLSDGPSIQLGALPEALRGGGRSRCAEPAAGTGAERSRASAKEGAAELPVDWRELTLKQVRERAVAAAERAYLDAVLREETGHVGDTARRAGIGSRALYDRMKRYGLAKEDYKDRADG